LLSPQNKPFSNEKE
jgi:hypothetical protein